MVKPILYGSDLSPPVRAVLFTVNAIGLDFNYHEVKVFENEHLSEEYIKKNPQHTIPMLEDDGKYIWDSHAVSVYLIEKYGDDQFLYPKDLYKRAVIDQRLHFDSGVLYPSLQKCWASVRTKGSVQDEDNSKVLDAYGFLEKFLATDLYLAGNCVTVADFCCVATITTLALCVAVDATKFPKLSEWLQRMTLLPYYQKANAGLAKSAELFQKMAKSVKP